MNLRNHSIPIGGKEPVHACNMRCWCFPVEYGGVVVHNAKDARERFERQGLVNKSLPWAIIGEEVSLSSSETSTF